MRRPLAFLLGASLLLAAFAAGASAAVPSATGPVTNGDFELPPVTRTTELALAESGLDRCFGIGHQVDYGSQTPQAEATGGPFGEPDPAQASPVGAFETIIQDPEGAADQQTACVWNDQDGRDVAHVNPAAHLMAPAGWSYDIGNPSVEFGYGFDGDVTDREAKFLAGEGSSRNLWKVFDPAQHAYTPNAEALAITVENGSIPDRAVVKIGLQPADAQAVASDDFADCLLVFGSTQLQTALQESEDGRLMASPVNAELNAQGDTCNELEKAWNNAEGEEERRQVLAQTRIVELGFWYWNAGTDPIVIDDVGLPGATPLAEEVTSQASLTR